MRPDFIVLKPCDATDELLKEPMLYVLLAQIAFRVKTDDTISLRGLKRGDVLLDGGEELGMTRKAYRLRLERLEKAGFIALKTAIGGTVATLLNTDVFDPFPENWGRGGNTAGAAQGASRVTTKGRGGEAGDLPLFASSDVCSPEGTEHSPNSSCAAPGVR